MLPQQVTQTVMWQIANLLHKIDLVSLNSTYPALTNRVTHIATCNAQLNHQDPHQEMGFFCFHISVRHQCTLVEFWVLVVYTEIGIGREEKLLDYAFLMKIQYFYCYAEYIPQPKKTRPLVTHKF